MLNLYYKPSCPFCQRVIKAGQEIGLEFNLLDVKANEFLREELIAKGGKKQVPFLEDKSRGEMLYESNNIIEYLSKYYKNGENKNDSQGAGVCPLG